MADSSQKKERKKSNNESLCIVCALKEEREDERQRRDDDEKDDEQKRGKRPAAFVSKRVQRKFSVRISKSFVFFSARDSFFSLISPVEEASVFV